jgi:peptide/nickel transport system permease protein
MALEYESIIFAPVPYAPDETDLTNANFKSPFGEQNVQGLRFRHWLGTDILGRDVLSGLIHGARIALVIGMCSMFLAALIGIPIGAAAGYLGDDRLRMRLPVIVLGIAFFVVVMYALHVLSMSSGAVYLQLLLILLVLIALAVIVLVATRSVLRKGKMIVVPVDLLTIRGIEIIRSIPAFFLLFAILGMVRSPKLIYVIILIAALWSPSIIRFVRAEALRLRNQTFVQSALVLGLSHRQIIWRHIIPNAIGPAMITLAFGVGSAVLIESGLSFLGIGIAPETMSWGKMLNTARDNFSAWWMALLPGLAIFLTIAVFNRLGDSIERVVAGRSNAEI